MTISCWLHGFCFLILRSAEARIRASGRSARSRKLRETNPADAAAGTGGAEMGNGGLACPVPVEATISLGWAGWFAVGQRVSGELGLAPSTKASSSALSLPVCSAWFRFLRFVAE